MAEDEQFAPMISRGEGLRARGRWPEVSSFLKERGD
jgi:hypothetical protein